jgi:hypothetical protein
VTPSPGLKESSLPVAGIKHSFSITHPVAVSNDLSQYKFVQFVVGFENEEITIRYYEN